jgi:catabolite regulation protein CreA
MRGHALAAGLLAFLQASAALADDIVCVSPTFHFIGANDKVCVSAFDGPMRIWPISTRVNKPANDDEAILEPVGV